MSTERSFGLLRKLRSRREKLPNMKYLEGYSANPNSSVQKIATTMFHLFDRLEEGLKTDDWDKKTDNLSEFSITVAEVQVLLNSLRIVSSNKDYFLIASEHLRLLQAIDSLIAEESVEAPALYPNNFDDVLKEIDALLNFHLRLIHLPPDVTKE